MGQPLTRIGVFYDGNYFLHVSNYYNYEHPMRRRISIRGLHEFVTEYIAEQEKTESRFCKITDAHYFRGRLSSYDVEHSTRLLAERAFDDILISEGVVTHYLPLKVMDGRKEEKGIDVWLALEAYELTKHKLFDVVVLIACDGDYVPLVRKLNTIGTKVMILGWDFQFTDNRNGKVRTTVTSIDLLGEATYPVAMHALIDGRARWDRFDFDDLFVPKEPEVYQPKTISNGKREQSYVLSLKDGYGFIAKPPNNLFFHWSDINGIDFNELNVNDLVEYSISFNDRGQEVASDVEKVVGVPIEEE
ncbi:MAG TPA: NYN domain-containing protein [Saprospiraceae bacterium]|nr:NYN domain-containing protein [Saprospiraceae bacterium]HMQ83092.1 NYN domain-containing protein [Saprospiraceae bacterium]